MNGILLLTVFSCCCGAFVNAALDADYRSSASLEDADEDGLLTTFEWDEENNLTARAHPSVVEDARLLAPDLIRKYGYPCEEHSVTTADGYILTMHRIPGSPQSPATHGKRVAFLQHGLLDSSATWVLIGPHHGLAYWLADLGYDVWLGNARGNRYSRAHTTNDPDGRRGNRRRFWSFSWHEIGVHDLPAMIDYVSFVTGQHRMHYVGHSQGTTAFFVMAAERPEYNERIVSMNALAPIAFMGNARSPFLRATVLGLNSLDVATSVLGVYEFLPNLRVMQLFGQHVCHEQAWLRAVCSNVLFLVGGFNSPQQNSTALPIILGHTPAGASTDQMLHYGQLIRASNRFRQYNHGAVSNLVRYGSITPPAYNLAAVRAPVALHYSLNDWLAEPVDVERLQRQLPNVVDAFVTADVRFNHFDFVWGNDVRELVYEHVLQVMRRFE